MRNRSSGDRQITHCIGVFGSSIGGIIPVVGQPHTWTWLFSRSDTKMRPRLSSATSLGYWNWPEPTPLPPKPVIALAVERVDVDRMRECINHVAAAARCR